MAKHPSLTIYEVDTYGVYDCGSAAVKICNYGSWMSDDLSIRTSRIISQLGYVTWLDLAAKTEEDIALERGVGEVVLKELREALAKHGLEFRRTG